MYSHNLYGPETTIRSEIGKGLKDPRAPPLETKEGKGGVGGGLPPQGQNNSPLATAIYLPENKPHMRKLTKIQKGITGGTVRLNAHAGQTAKILERSLREKPSIT